MKTVRLTTAQAIVRFLCAQRTVVDGEELPLVAGVFGIFGHGNVTSLGEALYDARGVLPTYRGQNEQGMALAAIGFAKAMRRRQLMAATTSIGPGAMNLVTAAAVAHANRLPLLLLAGDTFHSRIPDPVLQQIEHFSQPSVTVNDAFRPVTRYWDRITSPAQVAQSLPLAIATMVDPADCGPAFIGLPQDVQAEAWDFPVRLFEPVVHELRRLRPDHRELAAAAEALRGAKAPLIVAGGGVHYSLAEARLRSFAEQHGVPVVETMAGKSTLVADHPLYAGPIGVTGAPQPNELAARADVVLAVGTRLQDFTTGSWTVFGNEELRIVGLNAARFDAAKHRSLPLVADALEGLEALGSALGGWSAPQAWREEAHRQATGYHEHVARSGGAAQGSGRAVVRAGHRRGQRGGGRGGLRGLGRRRLPGRAQRQLALARRRDVRLRVRLLVHGLRARGGLGSEDGALARRGVQLRRRRLLPHAQLGAAELGHLGPQADRIALRQRRLRCDRAPAGRAGRAVVQQHVLRHRPQQGGGRLGRARTRSRL